MRGYRAMWHTLRLDYGIQAPRRKVEGILQQVEPEGTALRKVYALRRRSYTNPGPNFAWQVDDYDKLKPYGFPIHGAVDGFSHRVMWLKICRRIITHATKLYCSMIVFNQTVLFVVLF